MPKPAQLKTQQTEASVTTFLESVQDEQQRQDSRILLQLMEKASGEKPKMWGAAMIGFGIKRYKSPATGREVDWFNIGFSPRKGKLSLHLVLDIQQYGSLLERLGKHKTGVGCLYINRLADVDLAVLEEIINRAVKPS